MFFAIFSITDHLRHTCTLCMCYWRFDL